MAKDNTVTDFLLTKQIVLNSMALTALLDLKENLMKEGKPLYNLLRQNINKLISEQQALHDKYEWVLNITFFEITDKLNELIDAELLKK